MNYELRKLRSEIDAVVVGAKLLGYNVKRLKNTIRILNKFDKIKVQILLYEVKPIDAPSAIRLRIIYPLEGKDIQRLHESKEEKIEIIRSVINHL